MPSRFQKVRKINKGSADLCYFWIWIFLQAKCNKKFNGLDVQQRYAWSCPSRKRKHNPSSRGQGYSCQHCGEEFPNRGDLYCGVVGSWDVSACVYVNVRGKLLKGRRLSQVWSCLEKNKSETSMSLGRPLLHKHGIHQVWRAQYTDSPRKISHQLLTQWRLRIKSIFVSLY